MFIKPSEGRITSYFLPARLNPVLGIVRPHTGVDYGKDGSPNIIAAASGTVTRSQWLGGYGNCITIRHSINGTRYETLYGHLSKLLVKVGDKVKAGDLIGIRGSTGNSSGEHLHYSIYSPHYEEGLRYALNPLVYTFDPMVKETQELLNIHGYKLDVDGYQGESTIEAILKFQKGHGLIADGYVGAGTLKVLRGENNTSESSVVPPVANNQVAAVDKPSTGLSFSSPTLQKETEESIKSQAHREIVVKAAVEAGAHNSWLIKLADGSIADDDIFALAMKYIVDTHK